MSKVKTVFNDAALQEMKDTAEVRKLLNKIGFTITAHAVPHTGVDTGRLVASMSHGVASEGGTAVLYCGSNAHDPDLGPVDYADVHWTGKKVEARRPSVRLTALRGKRPKRPSKKTPTRPYTKALAELGINATAEIGGVQS